MRLMIQYIYKPTVDIQLWMIFYQVLFPPSFSIFSHGTNNKSRIKNTAMLNRAFPKVENRTIPTKPRI